MVFFGWVKGHSRRKFRNYGLWVYLVCRELGNDFFSNDALLVVLIEDYRSILSAEISALSVELGRIVHAKKVAQELVRIVHAKKVAQELVIAYLGGVELDTERFGMVGGTTADLLVIRIWGCASAVPHGSREYARQTAEILFSTPEATCSKDGDLPLVYIGLHGRALR